MITTARFSVARAQIRFRQAAHSFFLSIPAGMKMISAPRSARARATSGMNASLHIASPTVPCSLSNTGYSSPTR